MPDTFVPHDDDQDRELLRDMSDRATLLYWNSDRSVNSIADGLGLSKGRLYELIQPLRSGRLCPICQSDLVFDNRTSRDRDEAFCPQCDAGPIPALAGSRGARAASAASRPPAIDSLSPDSGTVAAPLAPLGVSGVVAGFLIGTVAGVLLGKVFRR